MFRLAWTRHLVSAVCLPSDADVLYKLLLIYVCHRNVHILLFNNSVKIKHILIIFGTQHPEET